MTKPTNAAPQLSLEGWEPALSPGMSLGLQLDRDFRLASSVLGLMLQATYTDDDYTFDANVPATLQDAHTKSDLRLSWEPAVGTAEGLRLEAFVLNLEDEEVVIRSVIHRQNPVSVQTAYAPPCTWGLSASYRFNEGALSIRTPIKVHPRKRGGNGSPERAETWERGPSPQARGKRGRRRRRGAPRGSIPASAGETARRPPGRPSTRVHPRKRGGNRQHLHIRFPTKGPSPQARGKPSRTTASTRW